MLTLAWFLGKDAVQFTGTVSQQSKVDNFRQIASLRSNDGRNRMATNFHVCRKTQFLLLHFISVSPLNSRCGVSVPGEGGHMERHSGNRVEHSVLLMNGERPADSRSLQKYSLRNVQDFKPRLYCCNASNYVEHNTRCLKKFTIQMLLEPKNPNQN